MKGISREHLILGGAFLIMGIGIGGASWYGYTHITTLTDRIALLEESLSTTSAELKKTILESTATLSEAINKEGANVSTIQNALGTFEQKVGTISGTLTDLQKLSKTDPELLEKYSKVFFLNENYTPPRLIEIPSDYKYSDGKALTIHALVWPSLKTMIDDAKKENVALYTFSAYRSFDEQTALKNIYTVTYGAGTANSFSADQGYSEHQLGTTVDIITTGLGGVLEGFDKTSAYTWLLNNAYKYGFVLSYPQNNPHYVFEPWHWRYVGVKLSTYLHNTNTQFYTMDQRDIDTYLISIFDQ